MKTTFMGCFLLLLAAPVMAQTESAPPSRKLAVVPFAALSGDVPQRAGTKAAGMLSTELKNTEGVALVDARKVTAADPHQETLETARKAVEEAKEHRKNRKFSLADQALQKAIADYRAGGPALADVGELVDAYALLSAVQFNTGRDEEGHQSLATALALAPSRELPLAKTSALYSRVVEDARKAIQTGAKGSLLVESTPSGAAVAVDGVVLGSTPLQIKDVPAGLHLWKVSLPSGETSGGAIEVAPSKQVKVAGQATTKDPESKIVAALSQNKIDAEVVTAAKEHAAATQADLLLFGALSKSGKGLALDAFLFNAASGEVRRLPRQAFDTELLSAGMEFYNLAGQLAANGKAGEPVKVPGPVSLDAVASGTRVAEAQYGVQAGKDGAAEIEPEGAKDTGPRLPLEQQKVRAPLKKKP